MFLTWSNEKKKYTQVDEQSEVHEATITCQTMAVYKQSKFRLECLSREEIQISVNIANLPQIINYFTHLGREVRRRRWRPSSWVLNATSCRRLFQILPRGTDTRADKPTRSEKRTLNNATRREYHSPLCLFCFFFSYKFLPISRS